jgi:hypothetical protein
MNFICNNLLVKKERHTYLNKDGPVILWVATIVKELGHLLMARN